MAVDAPKQATRRSSRLKVAGRLFGLLGLPLMVVFGIFAGGVYLGALRSYRIQTLEAEYLGLEPPAGASDVSTPEPDSSAPGPESPTTPPTTEPEPVVETPLPVVVETPPPVVVETPPPVEPKPATALPIVAADPVGAELRSLFDSPLTVRVKVLVDPALVVARQDWLSYVADLSEAANASFMLLFGVQIQLQGVVIWDRPETADAAALLADLQAREREGADVVLGFVAGTPPPDFVPQLWRDEHGEHAEHGDHALVFADLRTRDRYYRNLLRALATVLGATPVQDPAAKQLGSFMSDAEPVDGAAPVLDPDNRGRVIINKRHRFADSPAQAKQAEPTGAEI